MAEAEPIRKKRGLSSEDARIIRQRGHNDAQEFAFSIGMKGSYGNDPHAKKDVIDPSGDAHSVKSGEKKWQIFLYGRNRFDKDFKVMNGMGELLVACIDAFPPTFDEYQANKAVAKARLRVPMRELAVKLQDKTRLRAFLNKSLFNGGEINYLTIKHGGVFHVFHRDDVLKVLCDNLEVCNSRATSEVSTAEQKVILKHGGLNLGEVEMRNDSEGHYQEIRFNMIKPRVMALLFGKIPPAKPFNNRVLVYGTAGKTFGRWKK